MIIPVTMKTIIALLLNLKPYAIQFFYYKKVNLSKKFQNK